MRIVARPALVASLLLLAALPGQTVSAQRASPYTVVESGRGYDRLQDAVNAIGNGSGTIRFASFRFADCAVQEGGDILYTAAAPGQAVFDGVTCEGKAALVLRGRRARIDGMVFANMAVSDGNGAGIRLEKGDLEISQTWFRDSQQGMLTANGESGAIKIDKSTFTRLGTCEGAGGCAHSIYVGDYGSLSVTRSRFEAGRGGHYLKSRAPRIVVQDCSFDDSGGKTTNYMIDLPAGASGRIAGNWFVQGRDKENYSAFIAVAAEGGGHSSAGLVVENNDARFARGVSRESTFVANWSDDRHRDRDQRAWAKGSSVRTSAEPSQQMPRPVALGGEIAGVVRIGGQLCGTRSAIATPSASSAATFAGLLVNQPDCAHARAAPASAPRPENRALRRASPAGCWRRPYRSPDPAGDRRAAC